jgi:hypothetical protein
MTRNFDSLFADWLEDGPTRASDGVLEALAVDVARTPQRRRPFTLPRRTPAMTTFLKIGIAAAAVAVAAVSVGLLTQLPGPPVGSSPSPAAPTSHSVSEPPSPVASPTRYVSSLLPFQILLPEGWTGGLNPSGDFEQWQRYNPLVIGFVGSTEPPAGVSLDQYVAEAVGAEGESSCSTDPVEVVPSTMGGEPAFQIVYACDGRAYGLVAAGHGGRRYVLGTEAADLDAASDALRQLLEGFEFTD